MLLVLLELDGVQIGGIIRDNDRLPATITGAASLVAV
jgi:hypothetical protein